MWRGTISPFGATAINRELSVPAHFQSSSICSFALPPLPYAASFLYVAHKKNKNRNQFFFCFFLMLTRDSSFPLKKKKRLINCRAAWSLPPIHRSFSPFPFLEQDPSFQTEPFWVCPNNCLYQVFHFSTAILYWTCLITYYPVLYTKPHSPSCPSTVRGVQAKSEDSLRTVRVLSEQSYQSNIFYSARTLLVLY